MNLAEMSVGDTRNEIIGSLDNVKSFEDGRTTISRHLGAIQRSDRENVIEHTSNLYVSSRYPVSVKTTTVLQRFYNTVFRAGESIYPDITLANGLRFVGNWKYPMTTDEYGYLTVTAPFYLSESTIFDSRIIRVPYVGARYALYVYLPNGQVDTIFEKLNSINVQKEMLALDQEYVKLRIPPFTESGVLELKPYLETNGVNKIFSPEQADLRGLIRSNDTVTVSSVLQQTITFEVNQGRKSQQTEKVTEPPNPQDVKEFYIYKSFFYYVEDEITGECIISGKYII